MHQAPVPPDGKCSTPQAEVLPTASGSEGGYISIRQGESKWKVCLVATPEEIERGIKSLPDWPRLLDWLARDHPKRAITPQENEVQPAPNAA